jgi:antitoxin VapB
MESTVFMSNRSQAVRLPKALALPDGVKNVEIVAVGDTRIISPKGKSWDSWFDGPSMSPDFMNDREQPDTQIREAF